MKQDIENIIKNLPKYKNGSKAIPKDDIVVQYSALSLIPDEVLKVVVENYKLEFEKLNFLTFGLNNKLYIQKNKVLQLLNNLK